MILVLIIFINSYLSSSEGTTTCGFLKFSESAKVSGVSGAYISDNNDVSMIFSNPAGIFGVKKQEIYFSFANYLSNSKLAMVSYKKKFKDFDIGFGIINFSIDGIEKRFNDAVGVVPSEGSFSSRDTAFIFSLAKDNFASSLIDNLISGVSFKVINSEIDKYSGYAFAIDIGFIYKHQDNLNFSIAMMNLGSKMRFKEERDSLPSNIKVGMKYTLTDSIFFITEFRHYINDEKIYPATGFEFFLKKSFVFRTGYRFGYDTSNLGSLVGFGIGFGVLTDDVSLNYAYNPYGDLGGVNRFDIVFKF